MIRGLYGIADAHFGDPVHRGAQLLAGGVCVLQLRAKGWEPARVAEALAALRPLCGPTPLVVNDHAALAHLADGVHLGQDDGPFPPLRGLRGRSTHDLEQLRRAMDEDLDYVGFGPIFETQTKAGAGAPRGLAMLEQAVTLARVPIVAIGGITPDRLPAVRATGVAAWAIVSAILTAPDPIAAARACGS